MNCFDQYVLISCLRQMTDNIANVSYIMVCLSQHNAERAITSEGKDAADHYLISHDCRSMCACVVACVCVVAVYLRC